MSKIAKTIVFWTYIMVEYSQTTCRFLCFLSQINYFFHFELISIFEKIMLIYQKNVEKVTNNCILAPNLECTWIM